MRYSNSSLALATALLLVGFGGANATAQTFQAPASQPPTNQPPTDQAPGAKSDITRVQAGSDTSGVVWAKRNRMSPPWAPVVSSFPVQIRRIRAVPASKVVLKAKARPIRIQPLATPHLSSGGTRLFAKVAALFVAKERDSVRDLESANASLPIVSILSPNNRRIGRDYIKGAPTEADAKKEREEALENSTARQFAMPTGSPFQIP